MGALESLASGLMGQQPAERNEAHICGEDTRELSVAEKKQAFKRWHAMKRRHRMPAERENIKKYETVILMSAILPPPPVRGSAAFFYAAARGRHGTFPRAGRQR